MNGVIGAFLLSEGVVLLCAVSLCPFLYSLTHSLTHSLTFTCLLTTTITPMPPPTHKLSKTSFTHGCQCPKLLYLNKHHKKLKIEKNEVSAEAANIFSAGTNIGVLAQQVFPNGVDCSPEKESGSDPKIGKLDFSNSLILTTSLVEARERVIYEATFQTHNGLFCALDILVFRDDGWHGYEVKSTTNV